MTGQRKIKASALVRDIRSGMTDCELMRKYRLSAKGLDSVLKKLLRIGAITAAEYNWRPAEYDDTVALTGNAHWDE